MPGYNCSIKERMLYASCVKAVVETLEYLGINVVKKVNKAFSVLLVQKCNFLDCF